MKRIHVKRPSPALIVAVVALVLALTGSAVAAKKLGLSALSSSAKTKTVGVGKLTYTTATVSLPTTATNQVNLVAAACPGGTHAIGGGIKIQSTTPSADYIIDAYLTTAGYAGHVDINGANAALVTTTATCAVSNSVTGTPPAS